MAEIIFPDVFEIMPGHDDSPHWHAMRDRKLLLQRCASCGTHRHPPGPRCAACGSPESEWIDVSTEAAELYSYTVGYGKLGDSWPERYVIALILFPKFGGIRLVTNLMGVEPEAIAVGMKLKLDWRPYRNSNVHIFKQP